MGVGGSRSAESLDTGKDIGSAKLILERRLRKAKDSLDHGLMDRAQDKAQSALTLCSRWGAKDASPAVEGGAAAAPASLGALVLLDALYKCVWLLSHLSGGSHAHSGVMLRAMVVMADLAARTCEPKGESWELADIWFTLAQHASTMENWPVAVNFGTKAAALLKRLRGEGHYVANASLPAIPWDAFGKQEYSTCGYTDALCILAHAHAQLKDRREAQKAAAGHLRLLEAKFGRGHVDTIPGLTSMMDAACLAGEGDMRAALFWARQIVELRVRHNDGSPYTPEVAAVYEAVALMFLFPGPSFSPDTAEQIAHQAMQLRTGCLADAAPNAAVLKCVDNVRRARQTGRKNTRGVSMGGGSPRELGAEEAERSELDRAADEALEAGGFGSVVSVGLAGRKRAATQASPAAAAAAAAPSTPVAGSSSSSSSGAAEGSAEAAAATAAAAAAPAPAPESPKSPTPAGSGASTFESLLAEYGSSSSSSSSSAGGEEGAGGGSREGEGVGQQACNFLTQIASTL